MTEDKQKKGIAYKICMAVAAVGLLLFFFAAGVNTIYTPKLVEDCTYEMQHNETSPICDNMRSTQSMTKNLAIIGVISMTLFSVAGWMSERRRLRKK